MFTFNMHTHMYKQKTLPPRGKLHAYCHMSPTNLRPRSGRLWVGTALCSDPAEKGLPTERVASPGAFSADWSSKAAQGQYSSTRIQSEVSKSLSSSLVLDNPNYYDTLEEIKKKKTIFPPASPPFPSPSGSL